MPGHSREIHSCRNTPLSSCRRTILASLSNDKVPPAHQGPKRPRSRHLCCRPERSSSPRTGAAMESTTAAGSRARNLPGQASANVGGSRAPGAPHAASSRTGSTRAVQQNALHARLGGSPMSPIGWDATRTGRRESTMLSSSCAECAFSEMPVGQLRASIKGADSQD